MSRSYTAVVIGVACRGLAVVAGGQSSHQSGGFIELHRAEITDATELEVVMGLIERSGRSTSTKHYHPDGEFGFVLAGTVTVTAEGKPPSTLNSGDTFYQPPGEWHIVTTASEGAKTLVFRIVKRGQPMVVEVDQ
jgi:quercetin dioxygenase-like cupin family protein